MKHTLLLAALLLASRTAAADKVATAAEPPTTDDAQPAPAAPPVDDVLALRRGIHVGVGVGGAYLPGVDASAFVFRGDLITSNGPSELRVSPVFYRAADDKSTSTGVGIAVEYAHNFGRLYSFSIGALFSAHHQEPDHGDSYTTLGTALLCSPITLRFGAKQNVSIGLYGMILHENAYGTTSPGGYLSVSYLVL